MKRPLLLSTIVFLSITALAQTTVPPSKQNKDDEIGELRPIAAPPGLNDPATAVTGAATPSVDTPVELPVITVRKQGDDTIEEYRKHGQIYMIRILPKEGPAKYYVDHMGDGRLEHDAREGPISPVYFKLYEWK